MKTISMHGHPFSFEEPYAEGHTINEAEANTLNQTFGENVVNNFRSKIKAAAAEHNVDFAKGERLPEHVHKALQDDFAKAADEYEFGIRSSSVYTSRDPVRSEAIRIAKTPIRNAIRKAIADGAPGYAGKTLKDFDGDAITAAAERYIDSAAGETIMEMARRNISEKQSVGDSILDGLIA